MLKLVNTGCKKGEIMKSLTVCACLLVIAFLIVLPLAAQTRAVPGGSDAGRAVDSGAGAAASSSSSSATVSTPSSYAYSGETGNRAFGSSAAPAVISGPRLDGSSFTSVQEFSYWNNYYSYLNTHFLVYPEYFSRFIRNSEPLMTPAMLKLTLRQPLAMASEMLKAIDELETMLSDARAGKAVDKKALAAKSEEIREYAKQIRENRTISVIDTTASKKAVPVNQDNFDVLDPETIATLREMALDINRQLVNLYGMSSSSTVSVDSFKEPSFESETKAIDKLCKAIEHSSKQL
jgi:hypothetical protein